MLVVKFILEGKSSQVGDRPLIAVVPMATCDEYWKSIHAGAIKAARECNAEILWQGPITYNCNAQLDILETMITRQVKAIVVAPIDRNASRAAVENSSRSGIPVVVIDSDLNSNRQVSFIATDNHKAGYLAGKYLAELLHDKGQVVVLRGVAGHASTDNRERGFVEAIQEHPQIQVLSSNQRIGDSFEDSYKSAENLVNRFRLADGSESINGIFCPNESSTFAMLRVLQDDGLIGKLRFIGFDTSRKLNDALYAGQLDCLVVQNPVRMGYLGVKTAVDYCRGMKIDNCIDTGVTLATPGNAHEPRVHQLLEPDLTQWLN
jgi:ribose transport system substrate-binding protein